MAPNPEEEQGRTLSDDELKLLAVAKADAEAEKAWRAEHPRDTVVQVERQSMTAEQEQALTEKLTSLGYPSFQILPGEDDIEMLHIGGHFIGGALYALSLSDDQLQALIGETVQKAGD